MAVISELIRTEADGKISFGDYSLEAKAKKEDYEAAGDVYKVKTYNAMTKLEKNGLFAYESVPGTSVIDYAETENGVSFKVSGKEDAQITVGLAEDTEYVVCVDGKEEGHMVTKMGGKLVLSVELAADKESEIVITRA